MLWNCGIPYNSDKRVESGIKYSLANSSLNGHTCAMKENLIDHIIKILDVPKEDVENSIINLNCRKEIVIEKQEEQEWIYLYPFYKAEQNIAEKLRNLIKAKNNKYIKNLENEMKKQEKILDIELSEKQKEAIETVNENNVCIITRRTRNRKNNNNQRNNCTLRIKRNEGCIMCTNSVEQQKE